VKRALFALLLACGGDKPKPATQVRLCAHGDALTAYEELEARIPKMLAAMDQLAKDLAVKDDCAQIAAGLRKWGSQYAVELDALWELKAKLSPDERERYEHEHDEDAQRLKPVFDASLGSCQGDSQVEDALTVAGFRRAK
jgi:hypothetical protein